MLLIEGFIEKHGYPPTLRDLARMRGRTYSTIHYQVARLEETGFIERDASWLNRGIRVVRHDA